MHNLRKNLVMFRECFKMSWRNIMANRMRSFLTVLGILIGVMAVITLITTVNGFSTSLTNTFSSLGAGSLTLTISGSDLKSGLSTEDIAELIAMNEIAGVTPNVSMTSRVSHGGTYESGMSVSGKNYYYFLENDELVLRGRSINIIDEDNITYVCLISSDVVEKFFYGVNPIGESISIDGIPFLVVGLLNGDATQSIASVMSGSPDVIIPYTTGLKMNNTSVVTSMTVYLADNIDSDDAQDALEAKLDAMFSYEEDTYTITSMSSIQETMDTMLGMVSTLLAGIASIALLVGGIGIMNMMLTTVTERTTEIGLKKALGAIPWQIQMQFLIESFLLSIIGGVLGIGLGLILSIILAQVMSSTFTVSVFAIALGFGFSAAVGIIFGCAPARKASKLNPIDALRSV